MAKFYGPKNKIREIRQKRNLTLDEVYLKVGIQQGRLSKVERGIHEPNEMERKLLVKALRSSEKELFPEG